MPAFMTHIIFGQSTYKMIDNNQLRKIIKENRNVYNLGLHGPDIFFFFPLSFVMSKKNLGSKMHNKNTGRLFEEMIKLSDELSGEKRNIAIAYIAGFLGHYALDSGVHPYIYYFSGYYEGIKDYFNQHADFETELDYKMTKKYIKKDAYYINYGEYVKINSSEAAVIGKLLSCASKKLYNVRINNLIASKVAKYFSIEISFFKDKNGFKSKIFSLCEQMILGHEHFRPLVLIKGYKPHISDIFNEEHNEWYNPWNSKNIFIDSFFDLYSDSQRKYLDLLDSYYLYLGQMININDLKGKIGSKSYKTGLNC